MPEHLNDIASQNGFYKKDAAWAIGPKDFIMKYFRYLPWLVLSLALFMVIAYTKIRYTPQIFRVQSSLMIQNDQNNMGGKDQRFDELFMNQQSANLSNETEILRSRPVLQRVARDLGVQTVYYNKGKVRSSLLYPDAPFEMRVEQLIDSTMEFSLLVKVLNDKQFLLNEQKTPIAFGESFQLGGNRLLLARNKMVSFHSYGSADFIVTWMPLPEAAESLVGNLKVAQGNDQSTILTLSFENENSNLGRDALNTLMAVYDTLTVEDKTRIANNTLKFIDERLKNLKDDLNGAQGNLEYFMQTQQAYDLEGQAKSYQDILSESSKQKVDREIRMNVVDWLLDYIKDSKNEFNTVPTNLGIQEPALLQLVSEYNRLQLQRDANLKTTQPDNPLIVGLEGSIEKVRSNIYQALLNVKQAYLIAERNMDKQENEVKSEIRSLPGKSLQKVNIERQQRIFEELYSFLLQKKLETSISSASTISNSKVIEPATSPGSLVSPDKKKIYILYILMGLLLPTGAIAVLEMLRDKVSNRGEVEKRTQAPILGEIGHSENSQTLVVARNSRRFISEQFRIIRTNLQYVVGKKDKPVIMVTSSFSGEGKSFISTNMGAVIALTGKKTVIMEFDIRKPKIVSGLDLKRKVGITNYIIGRGEFEDLLVKVDEVENLYVIPCGPIPPNPAELLLDPKLEELMHKVREYFDVVIMDTAPVGLVSDAINLSRFADCTLYIIRQGYTFRKQVGMIEELYVNKKLPGLSLLLNDVKADGSYYGGYYGGYGYYAGYAYGSESGYFEDEKRSKRTSWFRKMWKQ
ncbi:MAG: polysaccharide biosynthesis tyrosine autokinase [Bacteroidota bacterium]|nr:polysaccharide biosynthesis tyrosine autokinase [Bacteroidota bacterium]MDP4217162.1 polysaccharide biosynthesis tyrosine autokinase [Bacteroidota bacterium]MDP4244429.1 polysaccharide biosynthesis tyrosine autokinase [Bacteroidota bacterium]MDP4256252.1 polysaccharide biosynthesis tyrosine autokinase [Bacteroidota bacterium]